MSINLTLRRKPERLLSAVFLILFISLSISCGNEYEKPSTTLTDSALISARTLKAWMDAGKVGGTGYDRVVILDVTSQTTYDNGHIPGAYFVNTADISQNRNEGIGMLVTEVLDGPKMDALIQKYGIDANTTIVFTGTPAGPPGPAFICRAYFLFRYWGFPRNRLKVLDGGNPGWTAEGYSLTTEVPSLPPPSTFSVRNNPGLRDDLRISLPEMIEYAEGRVPNALAIDGRGPGATTQGVFVPPTTTDFVVFEGKIRGAETLAVTTLYNANFKYLPKDDLIARFSAVGLDSTKRAYLYCRTGVLGAIGFFVLDGILGWPAALYDGSWSQWGQLSGNADKKGQLNPDSPWRTDVPSRTDSISYNWDANRPIEQFTSDGTICSATYLTDGTIVNSAGGNTACLNLPNSFETDANRIEATDRAYMRSGGSGGTGGGGGISPGC